MRQEYSIIECNKSQLAPTWRLYIKSRPAEKCLSNHLQDHAREDLKKENEQGGEIDALPELRALFDTLHGGDIVLSKLEFECALMKLICKSDV